MIETVILLPPPDCYHPKQTKFSAVNVFVLVVVVVIDDVVVFVVVVDVVVVDVVVVFTGGRSNYSFLEAHYILPLPICIPISPSFTK